MFPSRGPEVIPLRALENYNQHTRGRNYQNKDFISKSYRNVRALIYVIKNVPSFPQLLTPPLTDLHCPPTSPHPILMSRISYNNLLRCTKLQS